MFCHGGAEALDAGTGESGCGLREARESGEQDHGFREAETDE